MSKLHLTDTQVTNWFNNKRRQLNQARLSPKSCKKLKDCTALSGSPLPRDFKPQNFLVSTPQITHTCSVLKALSMFS